MKSADQALHLPSVTPPSVDKGTHAPLRQTTSLRPPSVILVLDTGTHAPWRPDRRLRPSAAPPPPSVILVPRHGNPRPLATEPPTTPLRPPPPSVILVPRHGNPRLPRPDRRHYMCEPRPRHQPLPPTPPTPLTCSLRPVEACPEPVEGRPETHLAPARPGPSARFTSKCRKMSQNVALFRPSTRKLAQVTSGKSHDLDRFPAILAHFRSFPASGNHVRGA